MLGDLIRANPRGKRPRAARRTDQSEMTPKTKKSPILSGLGLGVAWALILAATLGYWLQTTKEPAAAEENITFAPNPVPENPMGEKVVINRSAEDREEMIPERESKAPDPEPAPEKEKPKKGTTAVKKETVTKPGSVTNREPNPEPNPRPEAKESAKTKERKEGLLSLFSKKDKETSPAENGSQKKKILARVTVYWAQGSGTDKWSAKKQSASGVTLESKEHAAVDPKVIPYGSQLKVSNAGCPEGEPLVVKAVDTGSDVKTRKAARVSGKTTSQKTAPVIDLFFETKHEALAYAKNNPAFQWVDVVMAN
jgi:3D (Asp-Asp-Asp) domain-containing protein